ncbi:hypothetical protein V5O48_003310 [Marasmius crinis-equi]|uniref:WD40 repeat-like protein n=1 Tax=Marasmius crinis-equi TaxID=585013 RepID=A0ABR3FT70_9AGAR
MKDRQYICSKVLQTPAHISSLAFGHASHLFAGSDDGTVRLYDLSSYRVLKAVRGLGAEVSSIACLKRPGIESRDAWIACGRKMDDSKMILTPEDAAFSIEVCQNEEDVLNEIAFDASKRTIAFSSDSGLVGVVDVATKQVVEMKTKHTSICANVKFIPDRPREILSSGYDQTLLHFDTLQGSVLSERKMPSVDASVGGMTTTPPFVMCTAISPSGALAAGLADGRLWLGFGGEKTPAKSAGKKRARKWNGLADEGEIQQKVAEGPVVAATFIDNDTLVISTLLGTIKVFCLVRENQNNLPQLKEVWETECKDMEKANALVVSGTRLAIGGFAKDGKGIISIWDEQSSQQ